MRNMLKPKLNLKNTKIYFLKKKKSTNKFNNNLKKFKINSTKIHNLEMLPYKS